jgi:thioredoxin-like negative regulator of GroEL
VEEAPLIGSLRAAVAAAPDDVPLRLHLAGLLLQSGNREEAVRHAAAALEREPASVEARELLLRATRSAGAPAGPEGERFDWIRPARREPSMRRPVG